MCFGGSKKSTAAPAPSPPTTFSYTAADTSNDARDRARVISSTTGIPQTFGSELGSGAVTQPTGAAPATGGF